MERLSKYVMTHVLIPYFSAQIRILPLSVSGQVTPEGDVTPYGATFRSVTTPIFIV